MGEEYFLDGIKCYFSNTFFTNNPLRDDIPPTKPPMRQVMASK
jgi:hypothetical protein